LIEQGRKMMAEVVRRRSSDDNEWRRWAVLVATVWIQAVTGTNFDFSAYSSALKSSLGVSQEALNYLATASDLGKVLGWSSGLALLHMPLHAVLLLSAFMGLAAYAVQYYCLVFLLAVPYSLVRTVSSSSISFSCVIACLIKLFCCCTGDDFFIHTYIQEMISFMDPRQPKHQFFPGFGARYWTPRKDRLRQLIEMPSPS
jgi:hypothetical protein